MGMKGLKSKLFQACWVETTCNRPILPVFQATHYNRAPEFLRYQGPCALNLYIDLGANYWAQLNSLVVKRRLRQGSAAGSSKLDF
jgi:hypothetical protein